MLWCLLFRRSKCFWRGADAQVLAQKRKQVDKRRTLLGLSMARAPCFCRDRRLGHVPRTWGWSLDLFLCGLWVTGLLQGHTLYGNALRGDMMIISPAKSPS